jgi:AcrR family transcriptional regulator
LANEELKIRNLDHTLETTYKLFLEYGIDKTTKEMISRASGLSRKSIDRYFLNKTDCVIHVAEWLLQDIRMNIGNRYPDSLFTDGKHTGAELLRMYMMDVKDLFMQEPRLFVLYAEFKVFVYHNCEDYEQGYTLVWNWMGNRRLRQKIYNLGKKDGSLPSGIDLYTEEEYFCESFFGFLTNLAMSFDMHPPEETKKQIEKRIDNTIALYTSHQDAANPSFLI